MCIGILYTVVIIYVAATERSSWFPCKYSEHMCSQKKVSWTYVYSILVQRRTNLLRDREKKNICTLCMYTHHICSYIDLHSKVVACDRCDVRTSVWLSRIISTRALASSSTAQRRRWMNVCVCVFTRVMRIERGDRDGLSDTTCPCTEAKYKQPAVYMVQTPDHMNQQLCFLA